MSTDTRIEDPEDRDGNETPGAADGGDEEGRALGGAGGGGDESHPAAEPEGAGSGGRGGLRRNVAIGLGVAVAVAGIAVLSVFIYSIFDDDIDHDGGGWFGYAPSESPRLYEAIPSEDRGHRGRGGRFETPGGRWLESGDDRSRNYEELRHPSDGTRGKDRGGSGVAPRHDWSGDRGPEDPGPAKGAESRGGVERERGDAGAPAPEVPGGRSAPGAVLPESCFEVMDLGRRALLVCERAQLDGEGAAAPYKGDGTWPWPAKPGDGWWSGPGTPGDGKWSGTWPWPAKPGDRWWSGPGTPGDGKWSGSGFRDGGWAGGWGPWGAEPGLGTPGFPDFCLEGEFDGYAFGSCSGSSEGVPFAEGVPDRLPRRGIPRGPGWEFGFAEDFGGLVSEGWLAELFETVLGLLLPDLLDGSGEPPRGAEGAFEDGTPQGSTPGQSTEETFEGSLGSILRELFGGTDSPADSGEGFDLGGFDLEGFDLGGFDLEGFDLEDFDLGDLDLGGFDLENFDFGGWEDLIPETGGDLPGDVLDVLLRLLFGGVDLDGLEDVIPDELDEGFLGALLGSLFEGLDIRVLEPEAPDLPPAADPTAA